MTWPKKTDDGPSANDSIALLLAHCYENDRRQHPNNSSLVIWDHWKEFFDRQDDLVGWIDCHWIGFSEPVSDWIHFTLALVSAAVFLVGFLSNSTVIYIISRSLIHLLIRAIFVIGKYKNFLLQHQKAAAHSSQYFGHQFGAGGSAHRRRRGQWKFFHFCLPIFFY